MVEFAWPFSSCWFLSLAGEGNFNVIASLDEYKGLSVPDLGFISDFSIFIHRGEFLELSTLGGLYTWSGIYTWWW